MKEYKRGDIIYVDLGSQYNRRVQKGFRPCVIVSNNKTNLPCSNILNVCPLTKKLKNIPVHVQISPEDVCGYLETVSDFLTEQIVTIDKMQVVSKIGHIPEESEVMKKVNAAIIRQLELKDYVLAEREPVI